ncbi:hypothetical protein GCM10008959_23050 [Deinococcus seoulensis]|uniref:Uncharacterized protein n=2 Tax=Deinococcus seoulensis TaxID=1837379 RepID=A0ABQ2RTH7_9DEIO|nr:hypothetical protein GCM10008959_23050 [Deinococcus seoulensis]
MNRRDIRTAPTAPGLHYHAPMPSHPTSSSITAQEPRTQPSQRSDPPGATRRPLPAALQQILASDELTYRTAQAISTVHAHRQGGHWLRALLLPGDPPELVALLGERVQRPGSSIGFGSALGHVQHVQGRRAAPLGTDPTPLHALVAGGNVRELLPNGADAAVSDLTLALAGALDAQTRAAQPTAKPRFPFLRQRGPDPAEAIQAETEVQRCLAELREGLSRLVFIPLRDTSLDWDDVPLLP